MAALSVYLGLAIPDALDGTTLLTRGIISKSIMVLVLLRASIERGNSSTGPPAMTLQKLHMMHDGGGKACI